MKLSLVCFRLDVGILVSFGVIGLLFWLQIELNQRVTECNLMPLSSNSNVLLRPDAGLVRLLSFGQLSSMIDWIWIRAMAEDSSVPGKDRLGRSQFDYDLDLMTDLDPALFQAYVGGSQFLSVVRDESAAAKQLLIKGARFLRNELSEFGPIFRERFWSRAWELWMTLGYVQLFDLGDMPRAAEAFEAASKESGAPEFLKHLGKRLSTVDGQYDVGIRLLEFMMRSVIAGKNEKKMAELERKKYNLEVGQYLYRLSQEYLSYRHSAPTKKLGAKSHFQKNWSKFLIETGHSDVDPWGGRVSLSSDEEVISTTPHESVFKLK